MALPDTLIHLFRGLASAEAALVSVDRLAQLAAVPPEAEAEDDGTHGDKPAFAQTAGAVDIRSLRLTYNHDASHALNGLSLRVQPGCKLAVVGRSGAGKVGVVCDGRELRHRARVKPPAHRLSCVRVVVVSPQSSLLAALLRLYPVQRGRVVLDGVVTSSIPLQQLREHVTVIMQDPFVFKGTVRENLVGPRSGPGTSNDELLRALERVGLLDRLVRRASGKVEAPEGATVGQAADQGGERRAAHARAALDVRLEQDGANLSAGERQLLCLARAVLRGARYVKCV